MESVMQVLRSLQWPIFFASCIAVFIALVMIAWPMRDLYASGSLRFRVQRLVEATALREGWLLSDVSLASVSSQKVRLLHRPHLRGKDPVRCYDLDLLTGLLLSCSDDAS